MKNVILSALFLTVTSIAFSQSKFPVDELSFNAFRNPSIGLEYRHLRLSHHVGYYTTAFKAGEYTNFLKAGTTYWFAPVGHKPIPSSFLCGCIIHARLNTRLQGQRCHWYGSRLPLDDMERLKLSHSAIAVAAKGESLKINPTPGISYSISF